MNTKNFGAVVLSLLLLGASPVALLAHEGHEHGRDRDEYQAERGDSGRYDPQDDENAWEDDEEDDDTYRPSTRHDPFPEEKRPVPREYRTRPR